MLHLHQAGAEAAWADQAAAPSHFVQGCVSGGSRCQQHGMDPGQL